MIAKACATLALLLAFLVSSDAATLHLKTGAIDTSVASRFDSIGYTRQKNEFASRFSIRGQPVRAIEEEPQVIVQLSDLSAKEAVEQHFGVSLEHYLPDNAYVLRAPLDKLDHENLPEGVEWVGHFAPEFKSIIRLQNNRDAPEGSTVPLAVELNHPDESHATRVLSSWEQDLIVAGVEVEDSSDRRVNLKVPHSAIGDVMEYLRNQESVMWVDFSPPIELLNYYAQRIIQSGPSETPVSSIWRKGITGNGQIVGIGDTGLDWDNCFFNDPARNSVTINSVNKAHRKVIGYYHLQGTDTVDNVDGHGTHVAGSAVGSIPSSHPNYSTLMPYQGSAPGAKLFFTDLGIGEAVYAPGDLYRYYFPDPFNAGARIHSNSWGMAPFSLVDCTYDCNCKWSFYAQYYFDPSLTPGAPVDNNWCMNNLGSDCCHWANRYEGSSADVDKFLYENQDMVILYAAGNYASISSYGSLGAPGTAKNAITVGSSNTANANWRSMWKYWDYDNYSQMYGGLTQQQCCSYWLLCCPDVVKNAFTNPSPYSANFIADYSSRGPSFDNRVKPEIVAPGNVVVSAHSDGKQNSFNCGTQTPALDNDAALMVMTGTSMATPVAAGGAALVREYFTAGYYPGGARNAANAMVPSGPLIKAVMVHSGTHVPKTQNGLGTIIDTGNVPNKFEGYGVLNLSSVLRFTDSNFFLYVFDRKSVSPGATVRFPMRFGGSGTFKATVVYYDTPGSVFSNPSTVNKLSVSVARNGSVVSSSPADNNTVKQVKTNYSSGNTLELRVTGNRVTTGSQKFAVVVTTTTSAQLL